MPLPLIHPVILCGGNGTRLWPLSRKSYPKQFARLMGEESLFQSTIRRVTAQGYTLPMIVTGAPLRFIVAEQLAAIETVAQDVLIEPAGRNTAPAVLAAALKLAEQDENALMLVLPSDHMIPDADAFRLAVAAAVPHALAGDLVTFGIAPTRAETGYGWLELSAGGKADVEQPQTLARFIEKPDSARAEQMLADGEFLWNAGIFLFTAKAILAAYRTHAPQMLGNVQDAVAKAQEGAGFTTLADGPWSKVEDVSIDYAIMERASNLAVMPYSGGWSDLGGWHAVWQESGPDKAGNVTSDRATAIDCHDTLLRSETGGVELVGIGLDDIVAVAMNDAVLVARKSDSQRVKEAVAALQAQATKQAGDFTGDVRPWGRFENLMRGKRYQVKQIVVNPGAALSLQSHKHRAEHWVVVEGTARVTVGDRVRRVRTNGAVYIPKGAHHRLENPGKQPLVLIEVQTGGYLGEDDIVRYEDVYERV